MPYRYEKFNIAIIIIAMLGLPIFGYASFAEKFAEVDVNSALVSLGSSIDKSVSFAVALPPRTTHVIATTIDSAANTITTAAEDIAANVKAHVSFVALSTRQAGFQAKEDTLALLSSLRSSHNPSQPPLKVRGGDESDKTNPPLNLRGARGVIENKTTNFSPIKIIERIIVKDNSQFSSTNFQSNSNDSIFKRFIENCDIENSLNIENCKLKILQDPRINSLITNLADLTSRVDEKDGSPYRNSALFNMISQSQRIKTLDDVKITNATIEGYATSKGVSDSLATYLPLGGGHPHRRSHRNLSYALYHP